MSERLCKNCKHRFGLLIDRCRLAPTETRVDPVDGATLHRSNTCRNIRIHGPCGPEGKLWEAKT